MTKKIHMSPTRAFNFNQNPLRALEDYLGENKWFEGDKKAMLYGTIVHNIAEGQDMLTGFSKEEKSILVSSKGPTKGELKKDFKEAKVVGNHLHKYVLQVGDKQTKFEQSIEEPNQIAVDEQVVDFDVTGRADMLTKDKVYDFKTVAHKDFDGFLEYGTFRDHREVNYIRQVAFYAHMFEKSDAHLLYIQKSSTKPFIYDYQLTEQDLYEGWTSIVELITEAVTVIVRGKEHAQAINDGSIWAFKHYGGVINGN